MADRTVTLSMDEIAELVAALAKDHDGSDFEPECPLCTAYQKLLAAEGTSGVALDRATEQKGGA